MTYQKSRLTALQNQNTQLTLDKASLQNQVYTLQNQVDGYSTSGLLTATATISYGQGDENRNAQAASFTVNGSPLTYVGFVHSAIAGASGGGSTNDNARSGTLRWRIYAGNSGDYSTPLGPEGYMSIGGNGCYGGVSSTWGASILTGVYRNIWLWGKEDPGNYQGCSVTVTLYYRT